MMKLRMYDEVTDVQEKNDVVVDVQEKNDAVADVQEKNDKEQVAEGSCKAQLCSYRGTSERCVD